MSQARRALIAALAGAALLWSAMAKEPVSDLRLIVQITVDGHRGDTLAILFGTTLPRDASGTAPTEVLVR